MVQAHAAVLRRTGTPLTIETVEVGLVAPGDVFVRIRAASLCHTDLEAIEGSLAVKLPAVQMISACIPLEAINDGFAVLKRGEAVRSVVMFG